jgi:hypothetical protein
MLFLAFTRMTVLGISLIVVGIALVCAGLIFWVWPRPLRAGPADPDSPHEFRAIIDALDEEDRRSPDAGSAEPSVKPSIDPASSRPKHHGDHDHQEGEPRAKQGE